MTKLFGKKVLAVEDHEAAAKILEVSFRILRVPAKICMQGEPAVATIKEHHDDYGLVLLDVGLPDISGIEVTKQIRAFEAEHNLPPIYICAFTANSDKDNEHNCRQAGMNNFKTKPMEVFELEAFLHEVGVLTNEGY